MGLDTSHGAWHGAYSAFYRWRCAIAEAANVPLDLMEGFYVRGEDAMGGDPSQEALDWMKPRSGGPLCGSHLGPVIHSWFERVHRWLPISWSIFGDDPLVVLLPHSDCDGEIAPEDCGRIADRLEGLLPQLEGNGGGHLGDIQDKTRTFIEGCRAAHAAGEPLRFH